MADLSPAARKVFLEFNRAANRNYIDWHYAPALAAALRALAAQREPLIEVIYESDILAIANELENANDH